MCAVKIIFIEVFNGRQSSKTGDRYENDLLEKIKSLPKDYLCEVIDFVEYLSLKVKKDKAMYLSEASLSKDWLLKEEDEARKDL